MKECRIFLQDYLLVSEKCCIFVAENVKSETNGKQFS